MCITFFSHQSGFITLSKYSLISVVKYFWRNKGGFELIFIFPLLLRLWWLWTVLRCISPFLFVYFKGRGTLKNIFFSFLIYLKLLLHRNEISIYYFELSLWIDYAQWRQRKTNLLITIPVVYGDPCLVTCNSSTLSQ